MTFKKQDCGYLLDDLREASYKYYVNNNGEILDINGEIQNDERVIRNVKFYILYCMAYKNMDDMNKTKTSNVIEKELINRALASYGMFNYLINICIAEYRLYDEIGTGKITYAPYQKVADFFFENETRKAFLVDYLASNFEEICEIENAKKRVK